MFYLPKWPASIAEIFFVFFIFISVISQAKGKDSYEFCAFYWGGAISTNGTLVFNDKVEKFSVKFRYEANFNAGDGDEKIISKKKGLLLD